MAYGDVIQNLVAQRGGGRFYLKGTEPGQTGQIASNAIQQGQVAGLFSPEGSPFIAARLRRQALRNARNRLRGGSVMAQLAGLNPAQQRQALTDLNRDVSGQTADFLNEGQLQESLGNRDFIRQLFQGERGFEQQQLLERMRAKAAKDAQGGIGGFLGSAIGAVIPGIGAGIGNRIAGAGSRRGDQYDDPYYR